MTALRCGCGERLSFLALLLLFVVVWLLPGCGGGGGSAPATPATPAPQRAGLTFGYFGDADGQTVLTRDHTTFAWVFGWGAGPDPVAEHAAEAVAAGLPIVLGAVEPGQGESGLRALFDKLRAVGALASVAVIYPADEPDVNGWRDVDFRAWCAVIRKVAAEYPELANVRLASIYGRGGYPGADALDIVGTDRYGSGPTKPPLAPGQQAWLVAGGASPWREDPKPYLAAANADPDIVGIVAFLCKWPGQPGAGVCENGMLTAYCGVGRVITGHPGVC